MVSLHRNKTITNTKTVHGVLEWKLTVNVASDLPEMGLSEYASYSLSQMERYLCMGWGAQHWYGCWCSHHLGKLIADVACI